MRTWATVNSTEWAWSPPPGPLSAWLRSRRGVAPPGGRGDPGAEQGRDGAVGRGQGGGARPVEEAGRQRRDLRDRGPGEDLLLLPCHQGLLPALRPEPRLRPGQGPRPEGGRRADRRRGPPGRPARRPVRPRRPARPQATRGPRALPAPEPLPAGDPRPPLPRRPRARHARVAAQVSEPRDLGAGLPLRLNWGVRDPQPPPPASSDSE